MTHIIMKGYERVLCPTARDPLLGELAGQAAGSEPSIKTTKDVRKNGREL